MKQAIKIVNYFYKTDIRTRSRKRKYCHPRQVYLYCMRKVTKIPFEKLGNSVNLTQHATVIHAIEAIENDMHFDNDLKKEVQYLTNKLDYELNKNSVSGLLSGKEKKVIVTWLNLKGFDIDTKDKLWLQEGVNINVNKLIELLVEYKKD